MSVPNLRPDSNTSKSVLPVTGTLTNVDSTANPLPFGIYTRNIQQEDAATNPAQDFISGAVDQVAHVYKKLGGDVLDVEITEYQVYAAYEEAVLEYSYIVNLHQAKNILGSALGNTTGSFDHDGELRPGDFSSSLGATRVELTYPKYDFSYTKRVANRMSTEGNIGGDQPIYSASVDKVNEQADYDLQALIYSASTSDSTLSYYGKLDNNGKRKLTIRKVYYKTPHAMWRFFGYYGGLSAVGNLGTYGQWADDSTWEIIPVWQNKAQAILYEDHIWARTSHYSYEIKNNKLRLFPIPDRYSPDAWWVEFTIDEDVWAEDDDRKVGVDGVNNMNTLPFANIPYNSINSIGKQWIRRFSLALSKEMLGYIRGKFSTIPIPGESVTLNASDLLSQGKEEQDKLREELKTILDELTYQKLAEQDAAIADSVGKTLQGTPVPIFVG